MGAYVLYGAGNQSLHMEEVLHRLAPDIEVRWLIENKDYSKIGTKLLARGSGEDLDVITLEHFKKLYDSGECIGCFVPSGYHIFDLEYIQNKMNALEIDSKDVLTMPINTLRMPIDDLESSDCVIVKLSELEQICHLDIHVANHCNMNCEACSHFSPLAKDHWMISADRFENNVAQLHTKIKNICSISMLGGEPLLNPDLPILLEIIRRYYPYANIMLATNAILLESMAGNLIDSIKKNRITVSISLYPPLFGKAEDFVRFLRCKEIPFTISKIEKFERKLFSKAFINGTEMTKNCGHIMCLRDNRIGRCSEALFTDYYNDAYGEELPVDKGIDIYGPESAFELIQKLREPLELCNQCCARDHYYEEWRQMKDGGKPKEWLIPMNL